MRNPDPIQASLSHGASQRTRSRRLAAALVLAAVATRLPAQERERIEPPVTRVAAPKPHGDHLLDNIGIPPTPIVRLPLQDDDPDFAPQENVRDADGQIIGVRRIGNPYVLAFTSGSYTPAPGIDPALRVKLSADNKAHTYGFVMIRGRMSDHKRARLEATGVQVLDMHTFQSYRVRIPAAALPGLDQLEFVHWVGYARSRQKIDHNLAPMLERADDDRRLHVHVTPFEADISAASRRVDEGERHVAVRLGNNTAETGTLHRTIPNGRFHKALVDDFGFEFEFYNEMAKSFQGFLTKAQLLAVIREDWVHSVEPVVAMQPFHDQVFTMMHHDRVRAAYRGIHIPIGVIDTGIDFTPASDWHLDFRGKDFVGWSVVAGLSEWADGQGHGTHVSGTIFGSGAAQVSLMGGTPAAGTGGSTNRIFIGRYLDDANAASGNVVQIYDAFRTDYRDTNNSISPYPRIVNCSWGANSPSGYYGTENSAVTVDGYVYNHRQLYVFAAGNQGSVANLWCGTPASAKNVLSVGAVIDRFDGNLTTYPGQLAGFSRYSVLDYRSKPEIAAPGDVTTSCAINTAVGYVGSTGTSMATPAVSAVLASWLSHFPANRFQPELVKAVAVASATNQGRTVQAPGTGWGLPNSTKMHFNTASSQAFWTWGTFRATNESSDFTVTLPAGAVSARMVISWVEPAGGATSQVARKNDLRGYLDIAPFTSTNNTGDYLVASAFDNTVVRTIALPTGSGGKQVRVKTFAQSLPARDAHWAAVLLVYTSDPGAPESLTPELTSAVSQNYAKPSSLLTFTPTLLAKPAGDEFSNGRIWLQSANGFVIRRMFRITEDSITQTYAANNGHPTNPFPLVGFGSSFGMVVGQGRVRSLSYELWTPLAPGWHSLEARATYHNLAVQAPFLFSQQQVCVDSTPPSDITGLTSISHTTGQWSKLRSIGFRWSTAGDSGCAGIGAPGGLAFATVESASHVPAVITASVNTSGYTTPPLADSAGGYYFHIRAVDRALNWSGTTSIGPFKIDATVPVVNSVVLEGGATYTSKGDVEVAVSASDTVSGVTEIQYRADKSTPWMPYAAQRRLKWSDLLSQVGPGVQTVYVQVRDAAGNESLPVFGTIVILATPTITTITGTLPNVTKGAYAITGTNLDAIDQVEFGPYTITLGKAPHENDWYEGTFSSGSTAMSVYPPQARPPGTYTVRVRNRAGAYSNAVNVSYTAPAGSPYMLTQGSLSVSSGPTQYIICAQGDLPNGSVQFTMIGTKNYKPSVIPGVISMAIGDNWNDYVLLPQVGFDPATRCSVIGGAVPAALRNQTLYFQSAFFKPAVMPGSASAVASSSYR